MASPSSDVAPPPRRIAIVGPLGAGKTSLAHALGARTGLPVFHLDDLYWRRDWVRQGRTRWAEEIATLVQRATWIVDGNHVPTLEPRARAADLVVVLDPAPIRCVARLIARSARLSYGDRSAGFLPRAVRDAPTPQPAVHSLPRMVRKASLFRLRDRRRIEAILRRCGTSAVRLTRPDASQLGEAPPAIPASPPGSARAWSGDPLVCSCSRGLVERDIVLCS